MRSPHVLAILALTLCLTDHADVLADGLIHQLPKDGTWVRFDVTGEVMTPAGEIRAMITGTTLIKSVGQEQVEGAACRWIEIETETEARAVNGIRSKRIEDFKLLIPEKYLVAGQNPRAHIIKGWRRDVQGAVSALDLKDNKSSTPESLGELLNGELAKAEKKDGVELKVPGGTFRCKHLSGKESSETGDVDLAIQTWLTDEVPFGVAAYKYTKMRKRENKSLGGRWIELKFAESGTDAKSTIVPAPNQSSAN